MGTGCFGKLGRVLQTAIKFVVTKEGTTYNHLKPSDTSSKTSTTTHKQSNTILGPDYMANFIPGWNFSSANWAQISDRPLKQILWKPNCRLHGEGFSPGHNSARAENPSPVCSIRARIFSPVKRTWKSHVIETEFQPGPKKEREHAHWVCVAPL